MRNPKLDKFSVPENPKHISVTDKAKKYNDLKFKIIQDKNILKGEIKDLQQDRHKFRIGYKSGYLDGQISAYKRFVNLLNYYLE